MANPTDGKAVVIGQWPRVLAISVSVDHAWHDNDVVRTGLARESRESNVASDHHIGCTTHGSDLAAEKRSEQPITIVLIPSVRRIVVVDDHLDAHELQDPLRHGGQGRKNLFLDPHEIIVLAGQQQRDAFEVAL